MCDWIELTDREDVNCDLMWIMNFNYYIFYKWFTFYLRLFKIIFLYIVSCRRRRRRTEYSDWLWVSVTFACACGVSRLFSVRFAYMKKATDKKKFDKWIFQAFKFEQFTVQQKIKTSPSVQSKYPHFLRKLQAY